MRQTRTETLTADAEDLLRSVDETPREAFSRATRDWWRTPHLDVREHRPVADGLSPRDRLRVQLQDFHRTDAEEHHRQDADLTRLEPPRQRFLAEVADMWRSRS